jgi:ABC-2 type transport system permease protein
MTTATTAPAAPSTGLGASVRRTAALTRANVTLLLRNRTTLIYALVVPLAPLALLFAMDGQNAGGGATALANVTLMAALFPVFYNILSQMVTRRDELVLKRLRTGETRDAEIIASLAIPGLAVMLAITVLSLPVAMAAGEPFPANLPLYLVGALIVGVTFAALALWTAAWTRNAEAAQMTSLPVIALAVAGGLAPAMPERIGEVLAYTPGGAMAELVQLFWYGLDDDTAVSVADAMAAAVSPIAVLVAWAVVACALAARSMRWEPRA